MTANTQSKDSDDARDQEAKAEDAAETSDDDYLADLRVKLDKISQDLDVATVSLEKNIQEHKVILKRKRTMLDTANDLTRAVQDRLEAFKRLKEKVEDQVEQVSDLNREGEETDEEVCKLEEDFQEYVDALAKADRTFKPFLMNKVPEEKDQ